MAGVRQWVDWQARVGDALVYSGAPIGGGLRVTAAGAEPTGSSIVGISILSGARSGDGAVDGAHHHHLRWSEDCTIELLEEMPIPELAPPPDPARRAGPA